MAKHDFSDLNARYPEVIAQMEHEFSAHEFILRLAQQNQPIYIDALAAYRDSMHRGRPAPFRALHSILAKRLHAFGELVECVGEVDSTDIFGRSDACSQWRRL